MLVAGVDGCPGGWMLVSADADATLRIISTRVVPTFAELLRVTGQCSAIGIDIPIGLSDNSRRAADIEARKVLRPLRHNSVFPAPLRGVLGAPSYREACAISSQMHVDRKKISKQTYFLSPKIHEVDKTMTPSIQNRVIEVHPEVCFWALNGGRPISTAKRVALGAFERMELLSQVFFDDLSAINTPKQAARDDLLDACAAAWTAARFVRGEAKTLPQDPPRDSRGLRMEIVY